MFNQGKNQEHDYLLYNLKWDIGEHNPLNDMYPEKIIELDKIIEKHLKDSKAVIPVKNPDFDASKYHPENIGVQKGGYKGAQKIEIN